MLSNKLKITFSFLIIALSIAMYGLRANAQTKEHNLQLKDSKEELQYDEVCCGGDCAPNRCLNYGSHDCCAEI